MQAKFLLEQVVKTYSTCSVYKDVGKARQLKAGHHSTISFETSFERSKQLMFTWSGEAWLKKFDQKSWFYDGVTVNCSRNNNSPTSLTDIMTSDSLESTGLTGIVFHLLEPCFLNPELDSPLDFERLTRVRLVDELDFLGDKCSILEVIKTPHEETQLWIRVRDFAIMKVRHSHTLLAKDLTPFEVMFPNAAERYGPTVALEISQKWKQQDAVFVREFDFDDVELERAT